MAKFILTACNYLRHHSEESSQIRLQDDVELQCIFEHLHSCGAQITGLAVASMLDTIGISSRALDKLLKWRQINPKTCSPRNWPDNVPGRPEAIRPQSERKE